MSSPFPGMDPYLEDPRLWPDVHHGFVSEMQATLNKMLRPKYHVRVEERVYISNENDPGRAVIIPDLRVAETMETKQVASSVDVGGTAVAEPVVLTTLLDQEIHEPRLEVIDGAERAVVAVIELLSPTNKIAGSRGRTSFEEKRHEVMNSTSHRIEIDLLRNGLRFVARESLPPGDYFVHVSRVDRRPKGLVWPIRLTQPLPVVPIPLKPEDPDAKLNLQTVLNTAYDRAAYDLEIDYRKEPVPPLPAEYATWVEQLLRNRNLRG